MREARASGDAIAWAWLPAMPRRRRETTLLATSISGSLPALEAK